MKARKTLVTALLFVSVLLAGGAFAEPAYAQGRALVCVQTQGYQGKMAFSQPETPSDDFAWESIMDVSGKALGVAETNLSPAETFAPRSLSLARGANLSLVTSDALTTDELVLALEARSDVLFAEPDRAYSSRELWGDEYAGTPLCAEALLASDIVAPEQPYKKFQWLLNNNALLASGRLPTAGQPPFDVGNTSPGRGKGTVVAVLDSGVDANHPKLRDRMVDLRTYDGLMEETGCGPQGYNASTGASEDRTDIRDSSSHGTHVAGIIAASEGSGTVGIASDVSLVAVRVEGDDSQIHLSSVIRGYDWLVRANNDYGVGIRAVNISLGYPYVTKAEQVALQAIEDAGIVAVFSSGNTNENTDTMQSTGALGRAPSTLGVNALQAAGTKAPYSCYGLHTTDIFAPGSAILSLAPEPFAVFNSFTGAENARNNKAGVQSLVYESFEESSADNGGAAPNPNLDSALGGGLRFHYTTLDDGGKPATDTSGKEVLGDEADIVSSEWFLGQQSLAVSAQNGEEVVALLSEETDLTTKPGFLSGSKLYAGASSFAESGTSLVFFQYRMKDGTFSKKTNCLSKADWSQWRTSVSAETQTLPDGADLEHFQILVTVEVDIFSPESSIYLDSIGIGTGREQYIVQGGTSMAAPTVTGALGVIAGVNPQESAQQLSARIVGGAIAKDDLKGLCSSGGYLNIDKAINNPNPVPQKVVINGDYLTLSGWFFDKNSTASILVGGKAAVPTEWSVGEEGITQVRFAFPKDTADGLNEFTITTHDGRIGLGYLDVGAVQRSSGYVDLNIPEGTTLMQSELAAVGGEIFLTAVVSTDDPTQRNMFRYRIDENTWTSLGVIPVPEEVANFGKSASIWGKTVGHEGKLYTPIWVPAGGEGEDHSWLLSFDPTSDRWSLSGDFGSTLMSVSLVSWEGKLCTVGGSQSDGMTPRNAVCSIDPATGESKLLGNLPLALIIPDVIASGSELIVTNGMQADFSVNTTVIVTDLVTSMSYTLPTETDPVLEAQTTLSATKEGALVVGRQHREGATLSDTALFDKDTGLVTWTDKLCSSFPIFGQSSIQVGTRVYVWGYSDAAQSFHFFRATEVNDPSPDPQPGVDPNPNPQPKPDPVPNPIPEKPTTELAATGDVMRAQVVNVSLVAFLALVIVAGAVFVRANKRCGN